MNESSAARRKRLSAALRARKAQLPPDIARFADALWNEADDSFSHAQCLEMLPEFVSAEVAGEPVAQRYPEVKHHLDRCDSCAKQYGDLLDLALAEVRGELSEPTGLSGADLPFVPQSQPALQTVVVQWARQVLSTRAPQQVRTLNVIVDEFFHRVAELGGKFTLRPTGASALAFGGGESEPAVNALALAYAATEALRATVTPRQIDAWYRQGTLQAEIYKRALEAARQIGVDSKLAAPLAEEYARRVAQDPATLSALLPNR